MVAQYVDLAPVLPALDDEPNEDGGDGDGGGDEGGVPFGDRGGGGGRGGGGAQRSQPSWGERTGLAQVRGRQRRSGAPEAWFEITFLGLPKHLQSTEATLPGSDTAEGCRHPGSPALSSTAGIAISRQCCQTASSTHLCIIATPSWHIRAASAARRSLRTP